jgi:anti-sigma factor RsiW
MPPSHLDSWREVCWRRQLSAEESAAVREHLAKQPEVRAGFEEDLALANLLRDLPPAPLSSNFTAQVVQAVEAAEASRSRRSAHWYDGWAAWTGSWRVAWRVAGALAVLCLSLVAWQQYRAHLRADLVRGVLAVSAVASVPDWEALRDFDAIRGLDHLPDASDLDLLNRLQ